MSAWTKPAWYAHCWIFCLSQFGMPTTGLGVKLGMLSAQLTGCGERTGIYIPDRIALLVSDWLFISSRYVTLVFRSIGEFRRRP